MSTSQSRPGKQVFVYLNAAEREQLAKLAEAAGTTPPLLVKQWVLGRLGEERQAKPVYNLVNGRVMCR